MSSTIFYIFWIQVIILLLQKKNNQAENYRWEFLDFEIKKQGRGTKLYKIIHTGLPKISRNIATFL
jgi:hypothetical protein